MVWRGGVRWGQAWYGWLGNNHKSKEVFTMVYQWRFTMAVSAETAGKELERVEHKHGKVTPELVLEESRSKKAPLHKIFEWNDSVAAEKYRLTQAGQIINNLVVVLDEYEQHEPVRAFVNVNANAPKKTGEFINIVSAIQQEDTRAIVVANALRELQEFKKKYKQLTELSSVFAEIDKLQGIA
jgi:cell fate (sporulation/competence/biofilm development) regulator YlbF (YheA/YmcA/DUF963 family)